MMYEVAKVQLELQLFHVPFRAWMKRLAILALLATTYYFLKNAATLPEVLPKS